MNDFYFKFSDVVIHVSIIMTFEITKSKAKTMSTLYYQVITYYSTLYFSSIHVYIFIYTFELDLAYIHIMYNITYIIT
jgi:hypothetical protein